MTDDMKTIVIGFDVDRYTLDELKGIREEEGDAGLCSEDFDFRYGLLEFFDLVNRDMVDTENCWWFMVDVPADLFDED